MASNKLNFSPDRLITGINIVDNMLFFTDNENEPKKINIDSFKAADHSSGTTHIYNREFLQRDITVIRPHPPTSIKTSLTDSEDVNIEAEDPQIITDPNVGTTSSTALSKVVPSLPTKTCVPCDIKVFLFGGVSESNSK